MNFNHNKYEDWDRWSKELRRYKFNDGYIPKHKELFNYYTLSIDERDEFRKEYIHYRMYWAEIEDKFNYIIEEPMWEVYQFPLFKKKLCDMIIEEVEHFDSFIGEDIGPNRDNYATTDVGLDAIPGTRNYIDKPLGELYFAIQWRYLKPILNHVWKHKVKGFPWSWVAKYEPTGQSFLKPHFDNAVCASILSLNDDYEGGGTWFERQKTTLHNPAGWCTIHPSQLTHRHGARRVTKGKRYILVTFINCENPRYMLHTPLTQFR